MSGLYKATSSTQPAFHRVQLLACAVRDDCCPWPWRSHRCRRSGLWQFDLVVSYYSEARQVKSGACADLLTLEAVAGEPVELRFFVSQKRTGIPEDELQVQHEKFMHVIGVREDLNEFFHLHPKKIAPGVWVVSHTLPRGRYKIWADIATRGATFTLAQPLLKVNGPPHAALKSDCVGGSGSGCRHRRGAKHNQPLLAGDTNEFVFTIRDESGRLIQTEDFLGAPMHMVVIKDSLSSTADAHPEPVLRGEKEVRFRQILEEVGAYKFLRNFDLRRAACRADEALLAAFYVRTVEPKTGPEVKPIKTGG